MQLENGFVAFYGSSETYYSASFVLERDEKKYKRTSQGAWNGGKS